MSKSVEEIAGKFLGKRVEGKSQYDPSFLVAVPRQDNRTYLGLSPENCPKGFDTWYGYEFTSLTESGLPFNRVIKIVYPSTSPSIVESKSLKLYLNSFAMTRLGQTIKEAEDTAKLVITRDLEKLLETSVRVGFIKTTEPFHIFTEFSDLYSEVSDVDFLKISEYNENKNLLKISEEYGDPVEHKYLFTSLKSNCRVTHQPDFGDIFINYKSKKEIDKGSLIQYLCSFRNEFHFHEEICECCFTRLSELLDEGDPLMVTALYTRRGGIDINPCRYQNFYPSFDVKALGNPETYTRYGFNVKQ